MTPFYGSSVWAQTTSLFPATKQVYYFVNAEGGLQSQAVIMDFTNPSLVNFQKMVVQNAQNAGRQVLSNQGSLADAQRAFLSSIQNDISAVKSTSTTQYAKGLIIDGIEGAGGAGQVGNVGTMLDSTGILCMESSAIAQTTIETAGDEFSLAGHMVQVFNQAILDGYHAAVWVTSTDPSGMAKTFFNPSLSGSYTFIDPNLANQLFKEVGQVQVDLINGAGQLLDASNHVVDARPGSLGEALTDAVDEMKALSAAEGASAGNQPMQLALDFTTPAGAVESKAAGAVLDSNLGQGLKAAAQEADPLLFETVWADWGSVASDAIGEVAVPMMISQTMNAAVEAVNNDLGYSGKKLTSLNDLQGICANNPVCANSSYGNQVLMAVGVIFTQPVLEEVKGSVPNLLSNPADLKPGIPESFVEFNTFHPTGWAACSSEGTACYGSSGGISITRMKDGSFLQTDPYGITETLKPTGATYLYDILDGNGPRNYPLYKASINLNDGSQTLDDGYVSLPTGHVYSGGLAYYQASLNQTNSSNRVVVPGVTIDVTTSSLPLDTLASSEDSLISSIDLPTYTLTHTSSPFSSLNTSEDLGSDGVINSSPVLAQNISEGSQDYTGANAQATVTCSNIGVCSNSVGQSWVLTDSTYYASNASAFSYTPSGALCSINYMTGCYNNNPMGGFGGAGPGGTVSSGGGGGAGAGSFYNPCGIDGEFDPGCWAW